MLTSSVAHLWRGRLSRVVACLSIAAGTAACAPATNQLQNPANRAESEISRSFSLTDNSQSPVSTTGLAVDKTKISIEKSALEKEFLLQPSLIQQDIAPQFTGMKSRIVFFRQVDKSLYMIEASKGLMIARDYPQTLALAEFPITSETATTVTFDFNTGMNRLFIRSDWASRDFGISFDSYRSLNVRFSYIDRAAFASSDTLEIRQIAQVEAQMLSGTYLHIPVEMAYYLKPYAPNPNFQPTVAPRNYERMGFFEVNSQFNGEGGLVAYASKMDVSKPIVYAISANTPADYKAAVRDGILYWNKAFGKEVVKVVDAPAKVFAPTPNYNMVQWVDWDSAGFAYADAQMDPRTGEILHHQIYFTSAWSKIGKRELDLFSRQNSRLKKTKKLGLDLKGFGTSELCDMHMNEKIEADLSTILAVETDPAKLQKASTDLVREVVAHEVGHTLGLRHNFAGSLAANYPVEIREELFKKYLSAGKAEEKLVTASSVMDYQFPLESMMHGDQLVTKTEASEYDTKAIQALYFGKKYKATELPTFCTDSVVGDYADCMPYDIGSSYVAWTKYYAHSTIAKLPHTLVEKYIMAKAPPYGGQPVDVGDLKLDPKIQALLLLIDQPAFLNLLNKEGKLVSVERKYPHASASNEDEIRKKTLELITTDLAKNGEFEKVFANTSDVSPSALYAKFEQLLADPKIIRGETWAGKPYEFTTDELVVMKENAKLFFEQLKKEVANAEVTMLTGGDIFSVLFPDDPIESALKNLAKKKVFEPSRLADKYAEYLEKRADDFLFAKQGEPMVFKRNVSSDWTTVRSPEASPNAQPKVEATTLTIPVFQYSLELRKKVAGALAASRSESPGWAFNERLKLQRAYKKMVSDAIPGIDAKDSSTLEVYPRDMTSWILESKQIESTLGTPGT